MSLAVGLHGCVPAELKTQAHCYTTELRLDYDQGVASCAFVTKNLSLIKQQHNHCNSGVIMVFLHRGAQLHVETCSETTEAHNS
jgi:hypothetical protein